MRGVWLQAVLMGLVFCTGCAGRQDQIVVVEWNIRAAEIIYQDVSIRRINAGHLCHRDGDIALLGE